MIAPPTFAIVIAAGDSARLIADPGLGVNYAMVVHGEQSFDHARPLHAGDVGRRQVHHRDIKASAAMTTMATVPTSPRGRRARLHGPLHAVERGA